MAIIATTMFSVSIHHHICSSVVKRRRSRNTYRIIYGRDERNDCGHLSAVARWFVAEPSFRRRVKLASDWTSQKHSIAVRPRQSPVRIESMGNVVMGGTKGGGEWSPRVVRYDDNRLTAYVVSTCARWMTRRHNHGLHTHSTQLCSTPHAVLLRSSLDILLICSRTFSPIYTGWAKNRTVFHSL